MKITTKFFGSSLIVLGLLVSLVGGGRFVARRVEGSAEASEERTKQALNTVLRLEIALRDQTAALKDFLLLNRDPTEMVRYQKAMSEFVIGLDELEQLVLVEDEINRLHRRHAMLKNLANGLTAEPSPLPVLQQDVKSISSFGEDIEFYLNSLVDRVRQLDDRTHKEANQVRQIVGAIQYIIIALVALVIILQFRLILFPVILSLQKLQHGAAKIGAGELSYRLDVRTNDEIEQLAREFNQMAAQLAQSYSFLEEKVQERTAALEQEVRDRASAEAELQRTNTLLESTIESTAAVIFVKDIQGRYILVNSMLLAIFNKLKEEVIGNDDTALFPPEVARQLVEIDRRVLRSGKSETMEEELSDPRGRVQTFLTTKSPWRDRDGEIIGLVGIARDISDRKAAEEALKRSETQLREQTEQLQQTLQELQQTQGQLIQSEKMSSLGQLVAGVAHEINNPVSFIYGNIEHANTYLQDLLDLIALYEQNYPNPVAAIQAEAEAMDLDFLKQDLPKILSSMKVGAERIKQIVLSLRTFSRMDESDMKKVDIHAGIDSTLTILNNRLRSQPHRPEISICKEYGPLPLVECYAGQMNQVFMNVLSNAIDALEELAAKPQSPSCSHPDLTIRIRTEVTESNWVAIRIADSGIGMTEAIHCKLFDPFFTTKAIGKGTGLGLAISYQVVVEKHAGRFYCVSEPGQGTEFSIEIPTRFQSHEL